MQTITTIGLDIAKSVFQVHGVDADGNIVIRKQVNRRRGGHQAGHILGIPQAPWIMVGR